MKNPVLFARVTWMRWYGGKQGGEVEPLPSLQEVENFKPLNGRVFGFARPVAHRDYRPTVKLERILPDCHNDVLKGVTVIFVSTLPEGGQRVVGWYQDAVVYRLAQLTPSGKREYYFETEQEKAILIPEDARTCRVPAGRGAFGKSNLWYAFEKNKQAKTAPWVAPVLAYITKCSKSGVV